MTHFYFVVHIHLRLADPALGHAPVVSPTTHWIQMQWASTHNQVGGRPHVCGHNT